MGKPNPACFDKDPNYLIWTTTTSSTTVAPGEEDFFILPTSGVVCPSIVFDAEDNIWVDPVVDLSEKLEFVCVSERYDPERCVLEVDKYIRVADLNIQTDRCRRYRLRIKDLSVPTLSFGWIQRGGDIDGETAGDNSGNSVSLNSTGDILAIGAYLNDGNGTDSGHVRVYAWNGSSWVQRGSDIDGEAAGDHSGTGVSLNSAGDVLAIGAPNNDANGTDSGHVRVYAWGGSSWVQRGSDINGEAAGDNSGDSVSFNSAGDILAIGAYTNNGNGTKSGHVRIYAWNGSSWVQRGSDIDGEAAGDYSGTSVSLNSTGDVLAIGAFSNDGFGINSGHVRVYYFDAAATTTPAPITTPAPTAPFVYPPNIVSTNAIYSQSSVWTQNQPATALSMNNKTHIEIYQTGTNAQGLQWIRMDLRSVFSVKNIVIGCDFDNVLRSGWGRGYTENLPIQSSTDGSNWTTIGNTGLFSERMKLFSVNINARYIRITNNGNSGYIAATEFAAGI